MKIAIVVGTRPEIIKMSPIIKECESQNIDFFIVHSNQHYSENMDKIFFKDLNLPLPNYNLNVGSAKQGNQTGKIMIAIEEIFEKENPNILLVQGDTNTVLGAALAASKMDIKIGHVEAGLRSYDRRMPEEINRVITDTISDYLFCPTKKQKEILLDEGIPEEKIFIVGNTIVDAVLQNIKIAKKNESILKKLNIKKKEYFLWTSHRSLSVDNLDNLNELINTLNKIAEKNTIVFPIHPRTLKQIKNNNLKISKKVIITEPLGFLDFLNLENNAKLILTDSGGLQEEGCILKVPCVTLRENTERPETVDVGANIITWIHYQDVKKGIDTILNKNTDWKNPFGDGTSGKLILKIINNQ